tara:strand:+ start:51 stop:563 length:513 start_codon:yes stop_codon:yes gene_type:complete
MEIWKEIKGYEDYEVSNLGRVKSLARTIYRSNGISQTFKEKILKPNKGNNGYLKVGLYKGCKVKTKAIHQLVAENFLNHIPCGYKLVVDHINNIKTDNRLENLQVVTNRENSTKDKRKGCTSKYTGVYWNKSRGKWRSNIKINGKDIYLGYFMDETEAAEAYKTALKELR